MAFWNRVHRTSSLVIDIGSASVAGAYLSVETSSDARSKRPAPILYYTARLPIDAHDGESLDAAMLRTLSALTELLVREGAPTLRRETGSGHVERILVSVAAPWQETRVTVENIQHDKPFAFTHALLAETVERIAKTPPGRFDSGHGVVATLLNGYEIQEPFGKHAKRADIVVLASTIAEDITHETLRIVRKAFHTHAVSFTAFAPAAYSVFRQIYPHEKDYLILDVSGTRIDFALVQRGYLVDTATCEHGTQELVRAGLAAERMAGTSTRSMHQFIDPERNARFGSQVTEVEKRWVTDVRDALREIASRHALPRTLFLLADDDARGYLAHVFDSPEFHALWLSDEPLGIVPLTPAAFASLAPARALAQNDLFLSILALYSERAFAQEGTGEAIHAMHG